MPVSQNGYLANRIELTRVYEIPGANGRHLRLRNGAPGFLLAHFAFWFHENVEPLGRGVWDEWAYSEGETIDGTSRTSNHASGTAIDLNATRHPLAAVGTFTPPQTELIRRKLRHYNGCIRWGGDYDGRKDEMHFEIDREPAACARRWRVLRLTTRGTKLRRFNNG